MTKLPMDYKMCGDFASPLIAGDKLKFKVSHFCRRRGRNRVGRGEEEARAGAYRDKYMQGGRVAEGESRG